MYSLNDLILLMEAIRDKDNSNEMSRKHKSILKKSYELYIKANGIKDDKNNFIRQKVDTYSLVFDYILKEKFSFDKVDDEQRKDIQLFKALLDNKNKNVSLYELYKAVYKGILTEREINNRFSDLGNRKEFLGEINGCFIEETVGNIDISKFDGSNFEDISVDIGKRTDPLLFISSLNPVKLPKIRVRNDDEVTFITFSDLHLDVGCYDADPITGKITLNQEKFNTNLLSFINFRDQIVEDLKKKNVKVGGFVFTGDVFDAFTVKGHDFSKPVNFVKENREDLLNGIVEFKKKYGDVLKTPSVKEGVPTSVCYIAGNHDMTLGKKVFDEAMSAFGDDVTSLGSGSARIKVGKDFVAFMHHDSLDWGLANWDLKYTTRKARNKNTFRFNDYFEICKKYYENMGEEKDSCTINDLIKKVSDEMRKSNKKLYLYYLPYTIPNSHKNEGEIGNNDKKINPAIPFFANFMYIDPLPPHELKQKEKVFPEPKKFSQFSSLGRNLERTLSGEGLSIPQFGREDMYKPVLTVLGHFHTKLKGRDDHIHRVSHGASSGDTQMFPVSVHEGASYYEGKTGKGHYEHSATQYNLKVKNGRVSRIGVIPIVADLKKVNVSGRIEFTGNIDVKGETSYVPPKTH